MGKILRVDLSTGKITYESLPEKIAKEWIGGRGLGVYLAFKEIDPKVDPFSAMNKAYVVTGPLTGVNGIPAPGRWVSVTKSPLTYTIHDSNSGGDFGHGLKTAGFDAIAIEGASETPVYLFVHDGKAEIRDARHLWGKDVHTTTDLIIEELRKELGDDAEKVKVAAIGPAGENLVRFAAIMNDKNRAAGRGGHGAVWGSKKLKAIAVYGHETPKIADMGKFREVIVEMMDKLKKNPTTAGGLLKYGTAVLVNIINSAGIFPTRNFQTGVFPDAEKISGEVLADTLMDWEKQKTEICWGCPMGCARYTVVKDSPWTGEGGGPEYETIWAFGAQQGNANLKAIAKANFLCNELGLDTISMGNTIGCLMELVEKGKIPPEKLRGLKAKWGTPEAAVELVWRTAYRSGIGDELAEGSYRLAKKYGAPELSMSVRMQELPAYDPRGAQGHGLAYATSNRGGCHVRAYLIAPEILGIPQKVDRFATKGKAELVKEFQDVTAITDSLVICLFTQLAPIWVEDYPGMLEGVTGFKYTPDELRKIGEKIWNLERAFNVLSYGDGREYDTLPPRLLNEPMPEGPTKGHVVRLNEMLDEYYKVRGWKDGRPTRAKLEELGLRWVADLLEQENLLPE
ncbi:MAG: aldehyde ferredoxin oxidoreductase [Thermoprotei archaeon]|nr:MAG: aldehyde ferredoxin oxidoreductase [Thermoprotei archaeon]